MGNKKIVLTMITLSVGFVFGFFVFMSQNIEAAFNSDALYIPVLLHDLIFNGGLLKDWYLTPSPYIFPDIISFIPIAFIVRDTFWEVLFNGIWQALFYYVSLRICLKRIGLSDFQLVSACSVYLLTGSAISFGKFFQYVTISAHHFSVVVIALITLSAVLKKEEIVVREKINHCFIALISLLMALSDSLFIIQFTAPFFLAACLVKYKSSSDDIYFYRSLTAFFSSIAGYFLYPVFTYHKTRYSADIGLKKIHLFLTNYQNLPVLDRYNIIIFFLGLLFLFALAIFIKDRLKKSIVLCTPAIRFVALGILISAFLNSFIIIVTNNLDAVDRYFIPYAVTLTILASCFLCKLITRPLYFYLCMGLITTIVSIRMAGLYNENGLNFNYNDKRIACFDSAVEKHRLKCGIAPYWDAKFFQSLAGNKVELAQYLYDGDQHKWITTQRYFDRPQNFFIVNYERSIPYLINYDEVVSSNGAPDFIEDCGTLKIYIYNKEIYIKK